MTDPEFNPIAGDIKDAHNRVAAGYGILGPDGEVSRNSYNGWNLDRNVIQILKQLISRYEMGDRLMDSGCGNGQIAQIMLELGVKAIVGVDFSANMLAHAGIRAENKGFSSQFSRVRANIADLSFFKKSSFSAAILFGVIEHLDDPSEVIRQIIATLHPGGIFILGVPRRFSLSYFSYLIFGESPNRWGRKKRFRDHFNYGEKLRFYQFYSPEQIYGYLKLARKNQVLSRYPFGYSHLDGFPGKLLHFLGRKGSIGHSILNGLETVCRWFRFVPGGEYWVIQRSECGLHCDDTIT